MNRQDAWALLTEYTQNPSLIKHALAVEATMRALARKYGADENEWSIVGLLHDFDYERYPQLPEHPLEGGKILRAQGYPEHVIHAIGSHALPEQFPRNTLLDKAMFAADELSGFIVACTLVKPSKSLSEVDVTSVRKKLKDKRFAAGVNRQDVEEGAAALEVPLDEHIAFVIEALKPIAADLGLGA